MKLQMLIVTALLSTNSFGSSAEDSIEKKRTSETGQMATKNQADKPLQTAELNAKEFKAEFDKTHHAILLDVRTPEEFSEGHIDKAINIDFKSSDFEKKIAELDKTKSYFLYCRSGNRTKGAYDKMTKAGFKNIITLRGGILEWQENHFPVVK